MEIIIKVDDPEDEPTAFVDAVRAAQQSDVIVYHVGATCAAAPLRRWALGAHDAGLVLLVKKRVDSTSSFQHCAVRTKRKFRQFVPAVDAVV